MSKAQDRLIKSIRSQNFKKFISVAHMDNGDDFFNEVSLLSLWFHDFSFSFASCRAWYLFLTYLCSYFISMWQIDRHFSTFLVPDMTIEKPQKVATAHVDAHFKAKWLRWWNSPADVKEKNRFPSSLPLREKVLKNWLNKAYFWAQVQLFFFFLSIIWNLHTKD